MPNLSHVITGVLPLLLLASASNRALEVHSDTATLQIESLDTFQAEQDRLKQLIANQPPAYVDKVMDSRALATLPPVKSLEEQPEGLRSYYVEARANTQRSSNGSLYNNRSSVNDWSVRGEYRRQNLYYGEWIAQAEVNTYANHWFNTEQTNSKNARLTLHNMQFPLTTKLIADSALGDINSGLTEALGRNARFSLGSNSIRGFSTRIKGDGLEIKAGGGQRGSFINSATPSFEVTQGNLQWLGVTKRLSEKVITGIQFNHATQVGADFSNDGIQQRAKVSSAAAALNYQAFANSPRSTNARVTVVASKATQTDKTNNALGVFAEGGFNLGHYYHELGAFFSDPNLYFGSNIIANSSEGVYWRTSYNLSRLTTGMGIDWERYKPAATLNQSGSERVGMNLNFQQRLNRKQAISGNFNVGTTQLKSANTDTNAYPNANNINASVGYEYQPENRGTSRVTLTLHHQDRIVANGAPATGEQLTWDQDWIKRQLGSNEADLTTSIGISHDRTNGSNTVYPTAGVSMRKWLSSDWTMTGNLRYTSRYGNLSTSQGLSGALSTERTFDNGLQLGATLNLNEAKVESTLSQLDSPLINRSRDKALQVYVRWSDSRGKPFNTFGKNVMGAFGSLQGVIYPDHNNDGRQQPDERGLPNIEVLLDGRYTALTNAEGHYSFNAVAVGKHTVSLNLDTVPLPYGEGPQGNQLEVEIPLRGQVYRVIPIIRIKG